MRTNELKKGDRIQLRNGWEATIKDNMKGNTRMCEVEGCVTEIGSVYSHDMLRLIDSTGATLKEIEHTPSQLKLKKTVESFGF